MASLAYVRVPPSATRLEGDLSTPSIQRAKKVLTALPAPTPEPQPGLGTSSTTGIMSSPPSSSIPASITSPTTAAFSILPQLLLSSTIPPSPSPLGPKDKDKRPNGSPNGQLLISTRDPLSLPTTSANFKRFVAKSGPIFWVQDRVEEVVMWRRGWRVTCVWMAAYAFLCYFPKLVFALPHAVLIGVLLGYYPYPDTNSASSTSAPAPASAPISESVDWQRNLQAIQNLMGFVSDIHDVVLPHTHLLVLSPAHFPSSQAPAPAPASTLPLSPYPPYLLLALLVTFPPLLFLLASPLFPTRLVCLIAGLAPLFATHPFVRPLLLPLSQFLAANAMPLCQDGVTILVRRYQQLLHGYTRLSSKVGPPRTEETTGKGVGEVNLPPLQTILERLRDDDKLDDAAWRAEMREVELWENERYVQAGIANGGVFGTGYQASCRDSSLGEENERS
ncbi:hypothetical protein FPV67DRAFT_1516180 [Lyophyllum atratum]|nr:hypothetical protein FPV67DRAFT_1516180 [Lyophyllum atratum]